jgi:hypothetical protein
MKTKHNAGFRRLSIWVLLLAVAGGFVGLTRSGGVAKAQGEEPPFTTDFRLEDCKFTTMGANPYFILEPGYQLILEGEEDGEEVRVVITVQNKTQKIVLPNIGVVTTRVVEEREWVDDELKEVSKNFFAICEKTNNVLYFGEAVDNFHEDGTVTHEGSWRAGKPDGDGLAQPGLIMPGTFLLGSRYFQEIADDVAMDRGENVEMGLVIETEAGTFGGCVRVRETSPLEPGEESQKVYCPGVGLVLDDELELVDFGRRNRDR